MTDNDVIILGAGASGLMCAIEAGKRGRNVLVLDHANKAGKKILMSGGGRCNFTNYSIEPANYISHNPHFCKSALSRYTQWDFLALIGRYQIPFHERDHGQLFCDDSAKDILDMLLTECGKAGVTVQLNIRIDSIEHSAGRFHVKTG
ncbi:MAG: FAD-dependent oxidoreductase, partial [Methylobacter sp.]